MPSCADERTIVIASTGVVLPPVEGDRMNSDQRPEPEDEPIRQRLPKRAYEPPRVESIQLSGEAAEAPT